MKTISYLPSKDRLSLIMESLRGRTRRRLGRFTVWSDQDGRICGLEIRDLARQLEEFKKKLGTIRLGGIWKGVRISDEDIKEVRREMLSKLEERW